MATRRANAERHQSDEVPRREPVRERRQPEGPVEQGMTLAEFEMLDELLDRQPAAPTSRSRLTKKRAALPNRDEQSMALAMVDELIEKLDRDIATTNADLDKVLERITSRAPV